MFRMTTIIIVLAATISFAENYTETKMKPAVELLKKEQYEAAIKVLVSNSILEERIIKVQQTKDTWVASLESYTKSYGNFIDMEKVYEVSLGRLTKIYYLVYCKDYPLQFLITLYNTNGMEKLVNIEFNDKVVQLPELIQLMKGNPNVAAMAINKNANKK